MIRSPKQDDNIMNERFKIYEQAQKRITSADTGGRRPS